MANWAIQKWKQRNEEMSEEKQIYCDCDCLTESGAGFIQKVAILTNKDLNSNSSKDEEISVFASSS